MPSDPHNPFRRDLNILPERTRGGFYPPLPKSPREADSRDGERKNWLDDGDRAACESAICGPGGEPIAATPTSIAIPDAKDSACLPPPATP